MKTSAIARLVSGSWVLFVGAVVGVGCSSVEASKLPSGSYKIQCEKGMPDCVARAEKICKGKGYTILGGQNATKRVGGSTSSYQDVLFVGDLEIACGAVQVAAPQCQPGSEQIVHTVAGDPAAAAARVCAPGASQACVGPGGCQGGQVCLAGGEGFGACDCGSAAVAPAPPVSVAPAPAPAPGVAPAPAPSPAPRVPGAAPPAEPLSSKK